jgi:hypothetical protein
MSWIKKVKFSMLVFSTGLRAGCESAKVVNEKMIRNGIGSCHLELLRLFTIFARIEVEVAPQDLDRI